ncbi:MAG: transcription antitermination factor NusB [Prevotellaceae bacterium]|nr:transcription antitermination factor NusB [Prevotellaceae bacterium]MDY3855502.1 transcription antitermination factor NusB [Bacteroidaceae bacterium]
MINRQLIRLKVIQLAYAHASNEVKSLEDAKKELEKSLSLAYDLYRYLLLLIPEITDLAVIYYNERVQQLQQLGSTESVSPKFIHNRLAAQLDSNVELSDFASQSKTHSWQEADDELQALYKAIVESEPYKAYMTSPEDSYEADRELWKVLYKMFICDNEGIDNVLEEWSIYWNDDKDIVDTFVLKTIRRMDPSQGANQPLLPPYSSEEDREFAFQLYTSVLLHRAEYEDLIASATRNWDLARISPMDKVIMVTALAEILTFPSIPVRVSLSEYLNIAKRYSSLKSVSYINGILDALVNNQLKDRLTNKL